MNLEVGKQYRIKQYKKTPSHWNSEGDMDRYMGRIVTILEMSGAFVTIKEDERTTKSGSKCYWYFQPCDFEIIDFGLDKLFEI